jgi:hypothetical protein
MDSSKKRKTIIEHNDNSSINKCHVKIGNGLKIVNGSTLEYIAAQIQYQNYPILFYVIDGAILHFWNCLDEAPKGGYILIEEFQQAGMPYYALESKDGYGINNIVVFRKDLMTKLCS